MPLGKIGLLTPGSRSHSSRDQKMTVVTLSFEIKILLQPNLLGWCIDMSLLSNDCGLLCSRSRSQRRLNFVQTVWFEPLNFL